MISFVLADETSRDSLLVNLASAKLPTCGSNRGLVSDSEGIGEIALTKHTHKAKLTSLTVLLFCKESVGNPPK